jgi:hypothetical protein
MSRALSAAPASARSRHSLNLAIETFVSRATSSSGSPRKQSRDNRHLALNRKTLRAIPVNARRGACASFGGALRRPFGLAPVIIRHVEYSG